MRRGTTPTVKMGVTGVDLSILSEIVVTFKQGPVQLDKTPVVVEDGLEVTLTQEETLMFKPDRIKVQMKAKTNDGSVVASGIATVGMNEILNEEVL